jgi:hypothetical protein
MFDVEYCPTELMIADIFTKALPRPAFERFRDLFQVVNLDAGGVLTRIKVPLHVDSNGGVRGAQGDKIGARDI